LHALTAFVTYLQSECICCVCSKDNSEFSGSVFHKISSRLETAVHVDWSVASNETKFGVGAKYCPDRDTTLRVSSK